MIPTHKILVVDDERAIRELAQLYLEKAGFAVTTSADGRSALEQVKYDPPDLVVLDWMLPEIDGLEVCRRIRAESSLPILILTARDEEIDHIVGLEMGADDYMTKPFNPRLLVAHVKAILRRVQAVNEKEDSAEQPISVADVLLEPASRIVRVNGQMIELRAKEFDLLQTFLQHRNRVFSREQLLELVWGYDDYGQTRTVDVHVAHLREKLAASQLEIKTVWGKGYKLVFCGEE